LFPSRGSLYRPTGLPRAAIPAWGRLALPVNVVARLVNWHRMNRRAAWSVW